MMPSRYFVGLLVLVGVNFAAPAYATCSWTVLTNGNPANADQVMNNFDCKAPITAPALIGPVSISPSASGQPASIKIQRGIMGTLASDQGGISYVLNGGAAGTNEALVFDTGTAGNDYRLKTGGTDRLVITGTNGFVGVGVTQPPKLLTVGTDTSCTSIGICDPLRIAGQATGNTIGARLEVGFNYAKEVTRNNFATVGYVTTDNTGFAKGDLYFTTRSVVTDTAPSERLRITAAGNVGIGTSSPAQALEVNGQVKVDTLASASSTSLCINANVLSSCSSSRRYKENIRDAHFGLKEIEAMRPVTFKWKGRDEQDFGFIAEEVAKIDPRYVTYKDGKIEGVKYPQLTAVLVNAVKELRAANNIQAAKLTTQTAEITQLRAQNLAVRAQLKEQAADIQNVRSKFDALERRLVVHTAENLTTVRH